MKVCPRCDESKDAESFRELKDGSLFSYCRPCEKRYRDRYRRDNADRIKEQRRAWYAKNRAAWRDARLQREYGITQEHYENLRAAQFGLCAICETDAPGGPSNRLAVDHDHGTGDVRGLLCSRCNTALGLMKDDADLMRRAAEYLSKPFAGVVQWQL